MRTLFLIAAGAALLAGPALADHGPAAKKTAPHAHGAHGAMKATSTPADGAVLGAAPKVLTLSFPHPMTLQAVALTGPDGKTRPLPLSAKGAAAQTSVPLPALTAGAWRAAYRATAADGHAMTGLVRFTVR